MINYTIFYLAVHILMSVQFLLGLFDVLPYFLGYNLEFDTLLAMPMVNAELLDVYLCTVYWLINDKLI